MARDLRGVLDALLDGLVVLDANLRIELLNAEACRVLGVSSELATGEELARAGAGADFVRIASAVLESGGTQVESELRVPRRFAEDLVVDVAASPLFEDGAGTSGVVIVLRDCTIQRSLQDWVSERERLDAFGEIAAGIAHEVRNPLGGIRGAAEILAARSTDARAKDAATLIVREVDRIATLVDDLMIFKQGGALVLAPLNIHRVLDDVLDLLSMDPLGAGVKLTREFDPSIPEILGDFDRLVQVFLNLARNALQALDGEGRLLIETRTTLDHRLGSASGPRLPGVVVTVEDDGPGIPPELRAKVTTPFFTTRRGGTGLGLAVAGHWVARHGGTLRIGDAPGGGTRVRVSLPLRRPAEVAA
ncbi:MAG TPA: ATP-binding protein [Myxococcota bacterium]|nr:ATP-binding protein [Myxococcota bacterium]